MTATAAEALELALWLHRAPARRAALVGRPLPDGIGQLLRIAIGAPDQVAAAARVAGVEEATILEAVRFYLQQVLFHEEADAYRVLGLRQDATQERAREHHRLLQQWLHPDRSGEDAWESVYAVRINQAWSQLRTPQSRAAYDAALAATGAGALQGGSRHGGERPAGRPAATPAPPAPPAPPGRSRNLTLVVLLGCVGLLVLIALRRETPPQWQEDRRPLAERGEPATVGEDTPLAQLGAALTQALDAPAAAAAPVEPALPVAVAVPLPAPAVPVARANVPPAAPAPRPVRTATPEPPRALPEAPALPATVATAATAAIARPVVAPPRPAQVPPPAPEMPVPDEAPILLAAATAAPAPTAVPDAFDRMTQAQTRARDVLLYLGDPSAGLPPVWNDVATMQQAERIRAALHGRHGRHRHVPVELQGPQWRLSAGGARLDSRYRAGAEHGRIGLDFTWRESQLLVSTISLEPDA